jgi:DNA-binding CsgD family transcriptional regulator
VATARLDAAGDVDADLLVAAARLARYGYDFHQVERLARAALVDGSNAEAGLLLGESLHFRGRWADGEEVLATAQSAARDDKMLVLIVVMRARNLMWGLQRWEEALDIIRRARTLIEDPRLIAELQVSEAMVLTYSGQPADGLRVVQSATQLDDPRSRALHAMAELPALVAAGRCETAVELARQSHREHLAAHEPVAIAHPGTQVVFELYALNESGRLAEARSLAMEKYRTAGPTWIANVVLWTPLLLGRTALLSGQARTARRWFSEAAARSQERNYTVPHRLALSGLATVQAWLGEVEGAAATVAELDALPEAGFAKAEHDAGRVWALAAAGDLAGARRAALAAADMAATMGYRSSEAWLLHDLVRLGDPSTAVARLTQLAQICEGALIAAYALHAEAAAAERPEALIEAADAFERIGAVLVAAEAATAAGHAYQRRGERRAGAAALGRAATLAARCEGARTPGLATIDTVLPLTRRERDIATLAAQNVPSKEIAARLFLSVRTVNNHLQNVYTKLGVTSRAELVRILGAGDGST